MAPMGWCCTTRKHLRWNDVAYRGQETIKGTHKLVVSVSAYELLPLGGEPPWRADATCQGRSERARATSTNFIFVCLHASYFPPASERSVIGIKLHCNIISYPSLCPFFFLPNPRGGGCCVWVVNRLFLETTRVQIERGTESESTAARREKRCCRLSVTSLFDAVCVTAGVHAPPPHTSQLRRESVLLWCVMCVDGEPLSGR